VTETNDYAGGAASNLLNFLAILYNFKITKERLEELKDDADFPDPDGLFQIANKAAHVPYWKRETIAAFLSTHGITEK